MTRSHMIDTSQKNVITPGGNPICMCGEIIYPGQWEQHLHDVIAELENVVNTLPETK